VERAATRIHTLVGAVKRFAYMDRALAPDAIDLAGSLNDSVTLLVYKARKKSVGIDVRIEPNLPRVRAIGGDLNQVWTNLIDNAIDAVRESGRVTVSAARQRDFVVVRVVDDGAGIPSEIRDRIFDPFFTSKPVGQGTGLGLDIARQLVRRNDGDIEVESQPGRTEFRVTLRTQH
jgi:signal transduction histidine kinase